MNRKQIYIIALIIIPTLLLTAQIAIALYTSMTSGRTVGSLAPEVEGSKPNVFYHICKYLNELNKLQKLSFYW